MLYQSLENIFPPPKGNDGGKNTFSDFMYSSILCLLIFPLLKKMVFLTQC